ncbi:NUDIX hydrolase [Aliidiomarina soli]|uniref:DNA mismatch repair protein MutT n=1 Tax=Aliidiomarina soli TaxID=1928574 RepID=A0A432WIL7_9GAMM|nr:NUDIX domain-containing protein [Aliidiomarina soli]RUO33654.1 DNA mismatch repair protein MutT [Aliidiomarina soli]
MRLLAHLTHHSIESLGNQQDLKVLKREAARGIVLREEKILLMYTSRYDDFSFPGGGLDAGEDPQLGLRRELHEEAGAHDIDIIAPFGKVTEHQPTWKADWDMMFQTSYWYHCKLNQPLVANQLEHYEVSNGMSVEWVALDEAIRHNHQVMQRRPDSMGISIGRETLVMERVASELLTGNGEKRGQPPREREASL